MPSYPHVRSIPTFPVALVGIAVFAAGLLVSLAQNPSLGVHAQTDCVQPADGGCPMQLNISVQAAIDDPTVTDIWLLNVPVTNDFVVLLTNLPGDYEVWVYSPNGSLLGMADSNGTDDKVVQVSNAGTGTYTIQVDSANGDSSEDRYTLVAISAPQLLPVPPTPGDVVVPTPAPVTVPFNSYSTPSTFLPY